MLPVVIGGILVAALYNPIERLDSLNAAIVNEDEPVTIDDQTRAARATAHRGSRRGVGRARHANLTWTISNAEDADGRPRRRHLRRGHHDPRELLGRRDLDGARRRRPSGRPSRCTTPPDSLVVDDAITAQVATAAASSWATQLSSVYLENVFLGFTTLGNQLGTAADGATQLADGAAQAADGAAQLPDGISQLGRRHGRSWRTARHSSRAGSTRSPTASAAPPSGANASRRASTTAAAGVQNQDLKDAAGQSASNADQATKQAGALALTLGNPAPETPGLAQQLGALAAQCVPPVRVRRSALSCEAAAATAGSAAQNAVAVATSAGTTAAYANGTPTGSPL